MIGAETVAETELVALASLTAGLKHIPGKTLALCLVVVRCKYGDSVVS